MKRFVFILVIILLSAESLLSQSKTYTFNSLSWGASDQNWVSKKDGYAYSNGIQVTTGASGACGNSPIEFPNISKVEVEYRTNASAGTGTINVFAVNASSATAQSGTRIGNSESVTTSGGTSGRTITYTPASPITGHVQIYVTCTKNSIYIMSVKITYAATPLCEEATAYFNENSVNKLVTDNLFTNVFSTNNSSTENYISSNTSVATINPSTGEVTIVGVGTSTISVTQVADGTHCAVNKSYLLTVSSIPYTVTFAPGSGSCTTTSLTETAADAGVPLPTATSCADGWTFAGWSTSAVSETTTAPTLHAAGTTFKPTGDCSLYAVYSKTEGSSNTIDAILTIEYTDFVSTSYAANNGSHSKNSSAGVSIDYYTNQIMLQNSQMQWQANNSYFYNETNLGKITKVEINALTNNLTLREGASQKPTSGTSITPTSLEDIFTYTLSGNNGYIYISNGALSKSSYVKIYYTFTESSSTTTYNSSPDCCTPATASFAASTITKTSDDVAFTNAFSSNNTSAKAFTSSNTAVATVNSSTGEVTIVGVGTSTISVTQVADGTRCAVEESYELTVSIPTYTVTLNSMTNGSASLSDDTVNKGGSVTVSCTPNADYMVSSVTATNGSVSGSGNSWTVSNITANTSITVIFAAIPTYTVTLSGTTNGTAELSVNTVRSGGSVTVSCSPSTGYKVNEVTATNGNVSGSGNSWTVSNITANTTIGVSFVAIPVFTITFNDAVAATTTFTETCNEGSSITLPGGSSCSDTDWVFAGWASATVSETTTEPTLLTAGSTYSPVASGSLYAVYGKTEGESSSIIINPTSVEPPTSSYKLHTWSQNEINFTANMLYKGSTGGTCLQMNSNQGTGELYNTTPIAGLKSITINRTSGTNTLTVYESNSVNGKTTSLGTLTNNGTKNISSGNSYFTIKAGGAIYISEIIIAYDPSTTTYTSTPTCPTCELPTLAVVTTANVTTSSIGLSSSISNIGNCAISEYGFVYSSINETPTVGGSDVVKSIVGTEDGVDIETTLTGLSSNTTYYIRAYATNGAGTAYSAIETEATLIAPVITPSADLNVFIYPYGDGPSESQSLTIAVSNLVGNVNISLPAISDFEISLNGSDFTNSLQSSNASTTIYVRLKQGLEIGSYSDNITISATGAENQTVALVGQVSEEVCGSENFTNCEASGSSYEAGSFDGDDEDIAIRWNYTQSRGSGVHSINGKGLILQNASSYLESSSISGGIGSFSIKMKKAFTSSTERKLELYINNTLIDTSGNIAGDTDIHTFSVNNINIPGNFVIKIKPTAGSDQITIDDISWTCYSQQVGAKEYTLVTSSDELVDNGEYLFVGKKDETYYALGWQKTSNRHAVSVDDIANSTITVAPATVVSATQDDVNPYEITLKEAGVDNWNLFDALNGKYLIPYSSSNNGLVLTTTKEDWTISIGTDSIASIVGKSYTRRTMQFNQGSVLFACYQSTSQSPIYLYKCISPQIITTPEELNFTYIKNNGPSEIQSFTVKANGLTKTLSIVTGGNFEISTTGGEGFVASNIINLSHSEGTISETTIYVRLKAGLSAGNYNNKITISSVGTPLKEVKCNASVVSPSLTLSAAELEAFAYIYGVGPSAAQSFTLAGENLINTVSVTAPDSYEISLSADADFTNSLSLTPSLNTIATTTIYVRLKAGLGIGTYNESVSISISGTDIGPQTKACSGSVKLDKVANLSIGCLTNSTAEISWTLPQGSYEGIVIAVRNDAGNPPHTISNANPDTITVNAAFGNGHEFGTTEPYSYVVYKGTGTSVTVTGLTAGQAYKVKAYTYSGSNWLLNTECPIATISSLGMHNVSSYFNTDDNQKSELIWTLPNDGCFDEVMVVCRQGDVVSALPSGDYSSANADAAFGAGDEIATGEYICYKGNGTTVTITGLTNEIYYYAKIFVRKGNDWSTGVEAEIFPGTATKFEYGDLAIVAVNTNTNAGSGASEISFVIFKNLFKGTSIDFTDNGYERVHEGKWGSTEGTIRLTRTGANLPAGTVITFAGTGTGNNLFNIYANGSPDNTNWSISSLNEAFTFNLNSSDQIWIMQGGNWVNGSENHEAEYTGTVLYGWTATGWKDEPGYNLTSGSTIFPAAYCGTTNVTGLTNKDKVKYTGPSTDASRTEWIGRINDPKNWTGYPDNGLFDANGPLYKTTDINFGILPGNLAYGKWAGFKSTNWCDCANWWSLEVPDEHTDVEIPTTNPHDPILNDTTKCKSLNISGSISNPENAKVYVTNDLKIYDGTINFETNPIDIFVGGDFIVEDNGNLDLSTLNLNLTLTGEGDRKIESSQNLDFKNLSILNTGETSIDNSLLITGDLLVDAATIKAIKEDITIYSEGSIILQNGAQMDDNCLTNLEIILTGDSNQTLKASSKAIKASSITIEKSAGNIDLSSTDGKTDLIIATDFMSEFTGTSRFYDNGNLIEVGGDVMFDGDDANNYNLTGTLKFVGAGDKNKNLYNYNAIDEPLVQLHNLHIDEADVDILLSSITPSSDTLVIKNNLNISNGGSIVTSTNHFNIGGNYSIDNTSDFDVSNSTITFNGDANQSISIDKTNYNFSNIVFNNTATGKSIEISSPVTITGLANFNDGIIHFGDSGSLTFAAGSNYEGYSAASFVIGEVTKIGDGEFMFPLGDIKKIAGSDHNILGSIKTKPESGSATVSIEFRYSNNGMPDWWSTSNNFDNNLHHVSSKEHWLISSDQNLEYVSLHWADNTLCGTHESEEHCIRGFCNAGAIGAISDDEHLTIALNDGGKWKDLKIAESDIEHDEGYIKSLYGIEFGGKSSSKFITFGSFDVSVPLPVELTAFEAICENGKNKISWTTASERNNDYFIVEKSDNMQNFVELERVAATGNSNTETHYSIVDNNSHDHDVYYRLSQIDLDGKVKTYRAISSSCNNNTETKMVAFPNPFNDELTVIINNIAGETLIVELYDELGKQVYYRKHMVKGSDCSIKFDLNYFQSGIYNLRTIFDNKVLNQKVVKQ